MTVVPHSEAADRLAAFWYRGFTELNVAKAMAAKEAVSAESGGVSGWRDLSTLANAVGIRQSLTKAGEQGGAFS